MYPSYLITSNSRGEIYIAFWLKPPQELWTRKVAYRDKGIMHQIYLDPIAEQEYDAHKSKIEKVIRHMRSLNSGNATFHYNKNYADFATSVRVENVSQLVKE